MIGEIKDTLTNLKGKTIKIRYNLGRNKYETYDVIINELYDYIFTVSIKNQEFVKSFSYADVISKLIKIDLKGEKN